MQTSTDITARTGGRPLRRIVYPESVIADRVAQMGKDIGAHYQDADPLLVIGLLKGSFIFVADLVRQIPRPLHVDFLGAASYGAGTVSSGDVRLVYDPEAEIANAHVLLVEDIIDSGNTVNRLVPMLLERGPRSLELCAMLHKRLSPRLLLEPRWVGFEAPSEFLVGYGLDYSENFRSLPFIASI